MKALITGLIGWLVLLCASAAHAETAVATLQDAAGQSVGLVELEDGAHGALAMIELQNTSYGWHGIHIHETGDCSGEGFKSAGGHAGSNHTGHGFMETSGLHKGDMPNIWVHENGKAKVQYFLHGVKVADYFDADGAAVILHAGEDDYSSQPSGEAGGRIACGELIR